MAALKRETRVKTTSHSLERRGKYAICGARHVVILRNVHSLRQLATKVKGAIVTLCPRCNGEIRIKPIEVRNTPWNSESVFPDVMWKSRHVPQSSSAWDKEQVEIDIPDYGSSEPPTCNHVFCIFRGYK